MDKWFTLGWLVLAVALAGIELATPQMVSIWFALGAAVSMFVSLAGVPFIVQLASFALVSCAALLLSRPLARRALNTRKVKTNADVVVGMRGVVTEEVDNLREAGRVQVNGMSWSARSEAGDVIPPDASVLVLRIEGARLFVRALADGAPSN